MRTVFALLIVLFVFSTFNVQPGDTQVDLPEGAIARLNHGNSDLETVAFNPDGTILASGGGGEVQLWNVRTGILNHTIDGLGWVRSLAFSPNGTMLAIGLSDIILHLWNVAPASHIKQLEQSTVGFYDMAFSPDGTMLAVGSEDSRGTDSFSVVHLWDVSTSNYRIIRTLTGHTKGQSINRVLSVAFNPDGTTLAGGSVDGKVRLWDVSNWTVKNTLEHDDWVNDLAYSPDGTTIVTASGGYLHTWDVPSGTLKKRFRHGWAGDPLWSVAYSPDGTTIASGGGRGTDAALWDAETGALKKRLAGNNGSVLSVAYSPDGSLLATGGATSGAPNSVLLWGLTPSVPTPAMAPEFTEGSSATRAIAENTQLSVNIGTPVAATDADNDTLTYTLSGTDANAFSIDTTTGQLRTRAALDHETQSVYTVIITVSDGKLTDSITVTINITDIDEPELVTTPSTSDDTDNAQDSTQWHLPEGASARLGKGIIEEIAYSPDGGRLAVASGIGIWIYDAFTGAEVALFRGHTRSVLSVAYSRDGRTLATTSSDNTVRLWDAATGTLKNTLTGGVYSVAYSPDGSTLATGGYRDARLWDATTGILKNTLEHTNSATKVIFSPDGSTLATRGFNGTVRLWDTITGTLKNTLEHTTFVDSVAYSPDGATLATGGSNEIYLWDATSGTLKSTLEAAGWIYSIAYSPDGSMLAANGYSISSVGFRYEVHLWDTATGTLVRKLTGQRGSFGTITYSLDGRTLASASRDVVYLWDAATGALIQKLTGHTGSVYGTAYHPNERTLASAHYNGLLHLWDAATGNFINTHADGGNLYNIAYSPNGRTVAGGGYERVYLWDADNGNLIHTLEGHTSDVDSIAYSPDGSTIAAGSKGEVRLWDAATGTLTNTLEHPGSVKSLAYRPDGATLATGSDDRTARLWDAATGTLTNTLTGHTNWVNSVAYSPGGSTLATGSGREVRLWDAATGTLTHTLIGPHDVVYSIAYSPDGRTLASGNYNGAVRLWDMTTHTLLQTLMGHTGVVYSVAYSSDGTLLATGSEDGTVLLWDVAPTVDAYPAWDVNEDGQTNITDLILVLATFEKTPIVNPRTDVNGDGTVDKQDIIIVARHLGESTTPAAPISVALPERLTPEMLQQALDLLRAHNDGSLAFQRGIARLEQLLALLIPKETALLANYPNPFNPETWIPYELAEPADVSVRIYSVNGSLVRRLSLGHQAAGMYRSRSRSAYWDGKNELGESVASGVYFYTLTAGDFTATRKMLIRK